MCGALSVPLAALMVVLQVIVVELLIFLVLFTIAIAGAGASRDAIVIIVGVVISFGGIFNGWRYIQATTVNVTHRFVTLPPVAGVILEENRVW